MTRICKPKPGEEPRRLESIFGDCLERVGLVIPNGGWGIIDRSIEPRVGDLVHCDNQMGTIHGFIKRVVEIKGDTVIVGTAYADESKDYTFEASVIYGVVTEVFRKIFGNRVYQRSVIGEDASKRCAYRSVGGLCKKFSDDTCLSYCVDGPCEHETVRHGRWIRRGNEKKCSVCGFIYYSNDDEWNGCPNCLSIMDEKGKK